jgi:adenylate kinase
VGRELLVITGVPGAGKTDLRTQPKPLQ